MRNPLRRKKQNTATAPTPCSDGIVWLITTAIARKTRNIPNIEFLPTGREVRIPDNDRIKRYVEYPASATSHPA
jgi:hypothetical protein